MDQRIDNLYYELFLLRKQDCQPTGEHEVHASSCRYLPSEENRIYLGFFANGREAVREARKYYSNVDGCFFCCPEAHTR